VEFVNEGQIPEDTRDEFVQVIGSARPYVVLILKAGPRYEMPGPDRSAEIHEIIGAHAMRNWAMQKSGLMPIVCPIADGSGITGAGVFDLSLEDAKRVMDGDPAVQADVMIYELHSCFSVAIPLPVPPDVPAERLR